jgi:hypothetical protein
MQPLFGYTLLVTSREIKEGICFVGYVVLMGEFRNKHNILAREICTVVLHGGLSHDYTKSHRRISSKYDE